MRYDLDRMIDRRGSDSLKWNVQEHELPMWVADMDFATAPEIQKALCERIAHGVFGYTEIPGTWYQAYQNWWKRRHHWYIPEEWMIFCTGVIPAISSVVRKCTTVAEQVLVQTPVYNIFFHSIRNNGRVVVENPLLWDGTRYQMDFEDLECKLADPQTTLMILCNPHNPVGQIWDVQTLRRVGELCAHYGVRVISDEIHCDLVAPGKNYMPFASVSSDCEQVSITCIAPTKAFNLAGIQTAAVVVPNPQLRHSVWRGLNTDEVAEPNVLAIPAAIAAWETGEPWLQAVCSYIEQNKNLVVQAFQNHPLVRVRPSEATYLLWIELAEKVGKAKPFVDFLREQTGLWLSEGSQYGLPGERFLRMNVACPKQRVEQGIALLQKGLKNYAAKGECL